MGALEDPGLLKGSRVSRKVIQLWHQDLFLIIKFTATI